MSRTYRVHVHVGTGSGQGDGAKWLASSDFDRRPSRDEINSRFTVLSQPGRYEIHVCSVHGDFDIFLYAYQQGFWPEVDNPSEH